MQLTFHSWFFLNVFLFLARCLRLVFYTVRFFSVGCLLLLLLFFSATKIIQLVILFSEAFIFHQQNIFRDLNFFVVRSPRTVLIEMSDGQILILKQIQGYIMHTNIFFLFILQLVLVDCCDANNPIYQCRIIYKTVPLEFLLISIHFFLLIALHQKYRKHLLFWYDPKPKMALFRP